MDKVRLGVLGAGNIAAMNVRGYLEDPRCDIVAVCDTDEEIGRQAAKEWGAESSYTDLADLLADDSVDAVEVLTPTHMHHDHVIAALEAGKHVSVQKPVANSVEDALEMGAVAEKVGRTLRISECFVHYPPLELAKRLVAALEEELATEPHANLRYFCSPLHQESTLHPIVARWEQEAGFALGDTAEERLHKLEHAAAAPLDFLFHSGGGQIGAGLPVALRARRSSDRAWQVRVQAP